ncbi:PREDICTED: stonustoxin subunit alpha-like, partial [Cyprinodon variegatus]|uniref:stonustoxin subunit alpha-like n=1 Tax=Cyprinodon variegatus TaxID=28743 RepID=UPI00074272A9
CLKGVTLWDDKTLEDMTEKENHQSSDFKISASDSLEERSSVMDVSASLKASFMGGLVKVGGSAKYLNDQKSSKHQCRVTLQYKATTVYKHLTMSPAEMKTHLRVDDDLMSMATHVVTAISYGVNVFFVLDSQKLDVSSKSKIEGSLQAAVSKGGFGMEAEVSVKQSKQERSLNEQFTCKFYGDVIPESNPTTFTEALKTYKHLPKLLGEKNENSRPQKVWMMPLKKLLPSAAELVSELSPGMAIKVQDALEDFHNLKMRCNDCLEDSHSFPPIFERLTNFQNVSNCYADKLKETYAKKLPAIRAGKEEEKELLKLFIDRENSPFSSEKLEKWMTNSERETSVIDSCVKAMKDAKIILKESELTAEVQDHEEDVLCFVFTSLEVTDPYVEKMTDYLYS